MLTYFFYYAIFYHFCTYTGKSEQLDILYIPNVQVRYIYVSVPVCFIIIIIMLLEINEQQNFPFLKDNNQLWYTWVLFRNFVVYALYIYKNNNIDMTNSMLCLWHLQKIIQPSLIHFFGLINFDDLQSAYCILYTTAAYIYNRIRFVLYVQLVTSFYLLW